VDHEWQQGFAGAITVCDRDGIIVMMNDQSARVFADQGGKALLGTNVLDCHPEPSRSKLAALLRDRQTNVYTIEKRGVKKLIHQSPWYQNGVYAGMVDISVEIPLEKPHFVREG